jgi:hypothetical protein
MDIEYGFDSEHWWPDIAGFAGLFLEYLNNKQAGDGPMVKLKPKGLEKVKEAYFRNLKAFKAKVYGKKASRHKIDRHKVIALYIKSFLEVLPFYVENRSNKTGTMVQNCPNEYFSMQLMFLILKAWNDKKSAICLAENEKKWFIILLNHYRLEINTLDVLSLSQIIYYIEDKYIDVTVADRPIS